MKPLLCGVGFRLFPALISARSSELSPVGDIMLNDLVPGEGRQWAVRVLLLPAPARGCAGQKPVGPHQTNTLHPALQSIPSPEHCLQTQPHGTVLQCCGRTNSTAAGSSLSTVGQPCATLQPPAVPQQPGISTMPCEHPPSVPAMRASLTAHGAAPRQSPFPAAPCSPARPCSAGARMPVGAAGTDGRSQCHPVLLSPPTPGSQR